MASPLDKRLRWEALVDEFLRSGLSLRAYAQRRKLKHQTLGYWVNRLRPRPAQASISQRTPPQTPTDSTLHFIPIALAESPPTARDDGTAPNALNLQIGPRLSVSFSALPSPELVARFAAALLEVATC